MPTVAAARAHGTSQTRPAGAQESRLTLRVVSLVRGQKVPQGAAFLVLAESQRLLVFVIAGGVNACISAQVDVQELAVLPARVAGGRRISEATARVRQPMVQLRAGIATHSAA